MRRNYHLKCMPAPGKIAPTTVKRPACTFDDDVHV